MPRLFTPLILLCSLLWLSACSSTYYNALEKIGVHKRDVMVDRVSDARDSQEEAKEQFRSALEQFSAVVKVEGGDLEKQYSALSAAYENSKGKADQVHKRIRGVESVSEALFAEWQQELKDYSSPRLRQDSERKMEETRRQYDRLIAAMRRAEDTMTPVLNVFHDQVLYLKHNLNARAISSLQGELVNLEHDVAGLIAEMEASIREADQFILTLR